MSEFLLFIFGLLLFILPVPHTIAVRYILSGVLIFSLFYEIFKQKKFKNIFNYKEIKISSMFLFILSIWILFEGVFISPFSSICIPEIKSQWFYPVIFFYIGIYLSMFFDSKRVLQVIVVTLFIHVLYVDLFALHKYIYTHHLISRFAGLTDGPDKANYISNLLLAFLITEIINRVRFKKSILSINNTVLLFMLIMTLLSELIEGMRNGVIAVLFMSLSTLFFILYNNKEYSFKFKIVISIGLIILLSIPAVYNFKNDNRWKTLIETIPISINTTKYKNWMYPDKLGMPVINGRTLSASNYERIAWASVGIKEIIKHPFGVGYSRNAFKHSLELDYKVHDLRIGQSHSGIIDLALGIGIPGLLMWIIFIFYLFRISIFEFKNRYNILAVLLFFNVTGFFLRSVVDSNMRDHMFLTFMLITGLVLGYISRDNSEKNNISST